MYTQFLIFYSDFMYIILYIISSNFYLFVILLCSNKIDQLSVSKVEFCTFRSGTQI